jgi:hypothetical protein
VTPEESAPSPGERAGLFHWCVLAVIGFEAALAFTLAVTRGYGWEHGLTESLVPLGFLVTACWAWPDPWERIALATGGLFVGEFILVHLLEGALVAHALFFLITLLLLGYRRRLTIGLSAVGVLVQHVLLATLDEHSVYPHDATWTERSILLGAQLAWLALLLGIFWFGKRRSRTGPRPNQD